jgi:diguanylate cyclase (GGDEF)-like protein/PAS domain S-box-containing protein
MTPLLRSTVTVSPIAMRRHADRANPRGGFPSQNIELQGASPEPCSNEQKLKAFAEMSADWFWEQGPDLRFRQQSNIPLTSLPTDVGRTRWDFADPAMDPSRWDVHKADLAARRPFRDFRWERIQIDGKRRYMSTSGDPLFDEAGIFAGYHGTGRDITADVMVAKALCLAKEQAESANLANANLVTALRFANDAIIGLGSDYRVGTWNPAAERLYGLRADEIIGQDIAVLWPPAEQAVMAAALLKVTNGAVVTNLETTCPHPSGRITYVSVNAAPVIALNGEITGLIVTARDVTEQKNAEARILHLAHHDVLTELPNRSLLNDRLNQALNLAARNGEALAVLALDLDRFKAINDGFGHAAGDRLLVLVAERLQGALRASDTLARIGGDEFVVLQTDGGQPHAAAELAQRLIKIMSVPFEVNDLHMRIGTSVGIAIYPANGDSAAALLKNADTALYRAKAARSSSFCFFEAQMDLKLRERWALEEELRLAIGTTQLRLLYQPVVAAATLAVVGFEALLRWEHPVRGNIPPMRFIPIAEESGLIQPIGAWVLEEACRTACAWAEPARVAVNLSAAQLSSDDLPALVEAILRRTGLPPQRLELEVTETLLIANVDHALATLHALQGMGVQIACDDFGTGYSSFSYLQKLAFNRIKIDKSFVHELGIDQSSFRIVQAILAMAHSLGMDVTAEGVETEAQFAMLHAQGCDEIQGFLFGKPVPNEEIALVPRPAVCIQV